MKICKNITLKVVYIRLKNIRTYKKYHNSLIVCKIDPKYPIQRIKWSRATFITSEENTSWIACRKKIEFIQNQKYTLLMETLHLKETFLKKIIILIKAVVFNNSMSRNWSLKSTKTNIRNQKLRKIKKIYSQALYSWIGTSRNTITIVISLKKISHQSLRSIK